MTRIIEEKRTFFCSFLVPLGAFQFGNVLIFDEKGKINFPELRSRVRDCSKPYFFSLTCVDRDTSSLCANDKLLWQMLRSRRRGNRPDCSVSATKSHLIKIHQVMVS